MENSMEASQKSKNRTAIGPAIPLLGEGINSGYCKGTCTPMFIAALFTIAKFWKQPRFSTLLNRLRKCDIYIHIFMEFYSARKKNETLSFSDKWMELENIILSEVN
jgi:hypothetical protein